MPNPAQYPDDLGSLAQSARKTSLKNARRILFVLAVLQLLAGIVLFAIAEPLAKSQVEKEVKDLGGAVDPAMVREAEAEQITSLRLTGGIVGGLGSVFLILGLLVYRIPVAATVTALVIYVCAHLLDAAVDPTSLLKGIILKIIVIVALFKAVQAAIAYERENRQLAERPPLDSV